MLVADRALAAPRRDLAGNLGAGKSFSSVPNRLCRGQPLLVVPLAFAAHCVRNLVENNLHRFVDGVDVNQIARDGDRFIRVVAEPGATLGAVEPELPVLQIDVLGHFAFGQGSDEVIAVARHPKKAVLSLAELAAGLEA